MKELKWYVYIGNANSGKIEQFNIFHHGSFLTETEVIFHENRKDFNAFQEELRRALRYYFWSKCEWEVVIDHWPHFDDPRFKNEKIDVYDQVMLNWPVFTKYVWKTLKKGEKDEKRSN